MQVESSNPQKTGANSLLLSFFIILPLILASCTSRPVANVALQRETIRLDPNLEILILPPHLRFERIADESTLSASGYQGDEIAANLSQVAQNFLVQNEFKVIESQSDSSEISDLCRQLSPFSPELSGGRIDTNAAEILYRLASLNGNLAVFANSIRAKVGPGGYWNPNTGAIGSSMSNTVIRAALINCGSAEVLWRNEVLMRELPKVESGQYKRTINLLYRTFPTGKEN
jgi:hypothetical protein